MHAGHPCALAPDASSVITVKGNVSATDAALVLLNGITANKNVTLNGGFFPGAVNIVGHQTTGQCVGLVGGQ